MTAAEPGGQYVPALHTPPYGTNKTRLDRKYTSGRSQEKSGKFSQEDTKNSTRKTSEFPGMIVRKVIQVFMSKICFFLKNSVKVYCISFLFFLSR